jgi:hypothetical protein
MIPLRKAMLHFNLHETALMNTQKQNLMINLVS